MRSQKTDMYYCAEGSVIKDDVTIGDDSSIWYNAVIRGDDQPIHIGKRVNIQDNCTVHAGYQSPVCIGDDVTIGHNAIIHGCTIAEECLIGMGSILMDGCHIGRHCIIGAGSLITEGKTFAEGWLIMGSPAKAIRPLTAEEIEGICRSSAHYVNHAKQSLMPVNLAKCEN